jgi:hypothetical protein
VTIVDVSSTRSSQILDSSRLVDAQYQIHTLLLQQFVSVLIDTDNRMLIEAHLKSRYVVEHQ